MSFQNDGDQDEHWDVEIEAGIISEALRSDPDFIRVIAVLVRNQMLNDVRAKGNVYGHWAQTNPPPKPNKQRLS